VNSVPGSKKVLITGISGRIGQLICERLGARYTLTGIDREAFDAVPTEVADIADFDAIASAFEGIDVVVHLAANPSPRASWESTLDNNIIGTRNVFEAARQAGVQRIVYASSHHAAGFFGLKQQPWKSVYDGKANELKSPWPRLGTECMRPDSYYGVSKLFGESLGSYFHDAFDMSVICLRIGWVMTPDDPTFSAASLSLWMSHRDTIQLFQKSIDAPPTVGFAVVNGESNNALSIWDLEPGRRILGYEPEDDGGEEWIETQNSPPLI
jgi:nucleoside-diphosphate-sugar epimerase